jgi:hypothetical protein
VIKLNIKLKYLGLYTTNLPSNIEITNNATIKELLIAISNKVDNQTFEMIKSAVFLVNSSKAYMNTVLHEGDNLLILYTLGGG